MTQARTKVRQIREGAWEKLGSWMSHPAVQAAVLPFVVAGAWSWVVVRRWVTWAGLAAILGFVVTVWQVADFSLTPFTSTRKLIWAVLVGAAVGLACDLLCPPRRLIHNLWWVLTGGAALWMVWPVVQYRGGWPGVVVGAGALLFTALLVALGGLLRSKPVRVEVAAWVLPLGAGAVCLLGASALLGQLGLALGFAGLALWLVGRRWPLHAPAVWILPGILGGALMAYAGSVYAQVPVFALLLLGCVLPVLWIPRPERWSESWEPAYRVALAALPVALAVVWTAFTQGPPPL